MKLQKFNKIKYPYFFISGQNKKVMAILSSWQLRMIKWSFDFHKMVRTFYLISKWKNNGTLFDKTLKVWKNKVPLVFYLEAK